jgi:hypothetical protein
MPTLCSCSFLLLVITVYDINIKTDHQELQRRLELIPTSLSAGHRQPLDDEGDVRCSNAQRKAAMKDGSVHKYK